MRSIEPECCPNIWLKSGNQEKGAPFIPCFQNPGRAKDTVCTILYNPFFSVHKVFGINSNDHRTLARERLAIWEDIGISKYF